MKSDFLRVMTREDDTPGQVFLFDITLGMRVAGIGTDEVFSKHYHGDLSGKSIVESHRYFRHDAAVGTVMPYDSRIFGNQVKYPPEGTPMIISAAFSDPFKLYEHNPSEHDPVIPHIMESYEYIERHAPDLCVGCPVSSPFSIAAKLRGYEPLIMDTILEPEFVNDLLDFAESVFTEVAQRTYSEGHADFTVVSSAFDTPDVLGQDYYIDNTLPRMKRLIRLSKTNGRPAAIHPHGSFTDNSNRDALEMLMSTGTDSIYFGENIDLLKIRELTKGKVSLIGGIDSFTTIFLGNEERIRLNVETLLTTFTDVPFVVSCSCSVDRFLEPRKIKAMVDSTKSFIQERA